MFNLSTLSGINLKTDNYFQYTSVCKHLWKRTSLRFVLNAKTFYPKRTCVSLKTYLRLNSNALAFFYPLPEPHRSHFLYFFESLCIFFHKTLAYSKIMRNFAPVIEKHLNTKPGWPVRLSVRTQDFHSWKGGSIPPRATINRIKE